MAIVLPSVATAQTWEIHQYFGTPSLTPPGTAVGVPNVNPVLTVLPGSTVYLPVFIRMQQGDATTSPSNLTGFLYGISGVAGNGGTAANFTADAATSNRTLAGSGYVSPTVTLAGGPAVTGVNAPTNNFSLVSQLGYQTSAPGTTVINSAHSLGGADVNGAYWVGTVAINIGAGAAPGSTLDLFFREGPNEIAGTVAGAPYATSDQSVASSNVAFGADSALNPDAFRFGTGGATLINGRATAAEQFSSFADATIVVAVPEPGTLGLLALGLLGLRRRRSC